LRGFASGSKSLDARRVAAHKEAVQAGADLNVPDFAAFEVERGAPFGGGQGKAKPVLGDQRLEHFAQIRVRKSRTGIVDQFAGLPAARHPGQTGRIGPNRVQVIEFTWAGRGRGCVAHHENTCRTRVYSLTMLDFPNYIAAMDPDLLALEDRVRQVAELCQRLRAENSDLRQRMAQLTDHNKLLADKIDGAKVRLQGLLGQLPE